MSKTDYYYFYSNNNNIKERYFIQFCTFILFIFKIILILIKYLNCFDDK